MTDSTPFGYPPSNPMESDLRTRFEYLFPANFDRPKHEEENGQMNDLTVYERIADPLAAVKALGSAIARSRIFGCESEAQGEVLAWECLARRIPPLALKESYHLINTGGGSSLTMRADAMLAGFIRAGGHHRIIRRDGEAAEIELTSGGQTQRFTCTLAEAKEAGFTDGKKGEKENWSSPRQRMQMLWARVVSDGVRAMAPQVCAGRYTPEDFGVAEQDGSEARTDTEITTAAVVTSEPAPPVAGKEPAGTEPTGSAKDTRRTEPSEAAPAAVTDQFATAAQIAAVQVLFDELKLTHEQQGQVLRKRGVGVIRSLTQEQAAELIGKLKTKANQAPKPAEPAASYVAPVAGPASPEQVHRIKEALVTLNGIKPGTIDKVKDKLAGTKIADLTFEQARVLLAGLERRNIEEFFALSLPKPAAADPGTPADPC